MSKIMSVNFRTPINIEKISDEGITFSEDILLQHYHEQDCCENVYANWKYLSTESGLDFVKGIISIDIYLVPNFGINIVFTTNLYEKHKFFIPCYNEQNGYYSSQLSLELSSGVAYFESDISDGVYSVID